MNMILGYIATATILYGQWLLGLKKPYGFLVMGAGSSLLFYSILYRIPLQFDLLIINCVFACLSFYNFYKWIEK